jgi:hypothetical protein
MNKRDYDRAREEEFEIAENDIDINEIELSESLNMLLDDMYDELMETDCEHCAFNILKMAIFVAHQVGIQDGKMEAMKIIHCSMTDCEDCDFCEE